MKIDGLITAVMESFPLQLVVVVDGIEYDVSLLEDTLILQNNQPVHASWLAPGKRVTLTGKQEGGPRTLTAIRVELH